MLSGRRSSIAFLCVACGVAHAQSIQDSRPAIGDLMIYVEGVQPPLYPQEELIAGLPYDGISGLAGTAQDFETPFDVYDVFMIEDFLTTEAVSLSTFRSVGTHTANSNPFGAEDVVVRIFTDDGSGLPGSQSYTGELVLTSSPGEGFWNPRTDEWVTNFGGQCLPPASYFLVWAVRMDFGCCGHTFMFAQAGESTAGGGLPDNAWFWNPGGGWGMGPHIPFSEGGGGGQIGANYLLFGEAADCEPPCISFCGDMDGDGDSDGDDFFLYLDLFTAGDPCADIDEDGDIDGDDFFGYLDLFVVRC